MVDLLTVSATFKVFVVIMGLYCIANTYLLMILYKNKALLKLMRALKEVDEDSRIEIKVVKKEEEE